MPLGANSTPGYVNGGPKADFTYRAEGWDFLLGGGAVYDNLDYSLRRWLELG